MVDLFSPPCLHLPSAASQSPSAPLYHARPPPLSHIPSCLFPKTKFCVSSASEENCQRETSLRQHPKPRLVSLPAPRRRLSNQSPNRVIGKPRHHSRDVIFEASPALRETATNNSSSTRNLPTMASDGGAQPQTSQASEQQGLAAYHFPTDRIQVQQDPNKTPLILVVCGSFR
jgi:hypothetical protein